MYSILGETSVASLANYMNSVHRTDEHDWWNFVSKVTKLEQRRLREMKRLGRASVTCPAATPQTQQQSIPE
jgi:hypothetical protein